jgi:predicted dehydrogenase
MFIAGSTGIAEPPVNDIWTVPGEEKMLKKWVKEDTEIFKKHDPTIYYMQCQIEDFIKAVRSGASPTVDGEAGRKTVELFTAIYRSTRDGLPVKFPLKAEEGFDGRGMNN